MPFYPQKRGVDLTFFAKWYESQGWSVIPLFGDLDSSRAKLPAIKWGRYQYVHPQHTDFEDWFSRQGFGGLGIVCGRVSSLAVLDFDDSRLVSEFRHLHPGLAETRVIESGARRLPHFYYHIPDGLPVYSRSVPGVDLRADGAYVVAPPTRVGDMEWRVLQDQKPRTLSAVDLKAILRFLAAAMPRTAQNGLEVPSGAITPPSGCGSQPTSDDLTEAAHRCRNSDTIIGTPLLDLVALYHHRLPNGRNNALFEVACLARDAGWAAHAVTQALASVHALQPDRDGQRGAFHERHTEALRTIRSAYSRPPRRQPVESMTERGVGIPTPVAAPTRDGVTNSLREWLLQQGHTAAARLLDGLYLDGMQAGSVFTERQACERLTKYGIGRRSIMAALKTSLPDGQPLFAKVANPLHTTPNTAEAATGSNRAANKCSLSQLAKRVKTPGRPAAHYKMPDPDILAQRLSLAIGSSDPLTSDDLANPAAYRRALHREFVKRRPGQYARGWLAQRLGVSAWTCRRYEGQLDIVVQPVFTEQRVRWTNLESLVPRTLNDAQPGTYLEDEAGKRYPPLRAVAAHLLDAGRRLILKRRVANHYAHAGAEGVGIPTPDVPAIAATVRRTRPASPAIAQDSDSHARNPYREKSLSLTASQLASAPVHLEGVGIPTPASTPDAQQVFWLCPSCLKSHISTRPPSDCARCGASAWERVPEAIWRDQERLKQWWQSRWRAKHPAAPRRATPLVSAHRCRNSDTTPKEQARADLDANDEAAAQHLYQRIEHLSLNNARRLISRYGAAAVKRGLTNIAERRDIHNPAGFLVTVLRSEHLFHHRNPKPVRSHTGEAAATWTARMSASPFVGFLANADEFQTTDANGQTKQNGQSEFPISPDDCIIYDKD